MRWWAILGALALVHVAQPAVAQRSRAAPEPPEPSSALVEDVKAEVVQKSRQEALAIIAQAKAEGLFQAVDWPTWEPTVRHVASGFYCEFDQGSPRNRIVLDEAPGVKRGDSFSCVTLKNIDVPEITLRVYPAPPGASLASVFSASKDRLIKSFGATGDYFRVSPVDPPGYGVKTEMLRLEATPTPRRGTRHPVFDQFAKLEVALIDGWVVDQLTRTKNDRHYTVTADMIADFHFNRVVLMKMETPERHAEGTGRILDGFSRQAAQRIEASTKGGGLK